MITGPSRGSRFDNAIAKNARELFDLDDRSRLVLAHVARDGPQTIYELQEHDELSKAAVHRRLYGKGILLTQKFLRLEGRVTFDRNKKIQKKYYGLDLKGFLASLSEVKCDDNYMFKILLQAMCDYYASLNAIKLTHEERKDFSYHGRIRVMTDIRAFLSYYAKQGVKLTGITNPLLFYLGFWLTPMRLSEDVESDFASELGLVRKAFALIKPPAIFNDPWAGPFATCWFTWQIIQKERLKIGSVVDRDLFYAFLNEYGREMRELREGKDPPWDYGILLAGKPVRELKEKKVIQDLDVKG
jgi:hypothetical protein